MAIVKRTRSGKAILFVDDDGNCFMTSVKYMEGILSGRFKGFGLLTRFPQKVKEGLFEKSPLVGEKFSKSYEGSAFGDHSVAKKIEDLKVVGDLEEW